MKARVLFAAFAAFALMAACTPDPQPKPDEFKAALNVSGVTGNTINVPAAGKDVTFKVAANISWSVANTAAWITVEPASNENANKETVETTVTVKVAANESEEAREAALTISADGIDPVAVTVKQAGVEKPEVILEVFDVDAFEAIADFALELPGMNAAASFTIHATANWAATAPEWLTIEPASWEFDGENDLVTVAVVATAATAARTGELKLAADGKELAIAVSQAAAPTIGIAAAEADYPYSQIAFTITPAAESDWYAYIYAPKATADQMGVQGLCDYMLTSRNNYLANYSAEVILDALCYQGANTYVESDMKEQTAYTVVACGLAYDEVNNVFVQSTLGASVEITTTAAPVASEAYLAFIGDFKGTVYDYFGKADADFTFTIEPFGINETYLVGSADDIISPVGSNGTYDRYIAYFDEKSNSILFDAVTESDLGAYWNFNGIGTCQVILCAFYYQANEDITYWGLQMGSDGNTLSAFAYPAVPAGDALLFGGNIITAAGEDTGYAYGYGIVESDFVRVEKAASALSVKNDIVDCAQKNLKALKARKAVK